MEVIDTIVTCRLAIQVWHGWIPELVLPGWPDRSLSSAMCLPPTRCWKRPAPRPASTTSATTPSGTAWRSCCRRCRRGPTERAWPGVPAPAHRGLPRAAPAGRGLVSPAPRDRRGAHQRAADRVGITANRVDRVVHAAGSRSRRALPAPVGVVAAVSAALDRAG